MVRPNRSASAGHLAARTRVMAVAVASCFAAAPAWALNEADLKAVVGGFTASQTGNVNVLTLTTATNRTLVEAQQRFNVQANEQFRVLQPSSSSLFLLRVLPGQSGILEKSVINGSIYSNGQFWLQNAAGVLIGKGAVIDTAGFLATTMAVRMEDFLAARLSFLSNPDIGGIGSIVNEGTITTHSGGSVYLIGGGVENKGVITAPGGETILAAGHTVSLVDTGTPGVKVEITGEQGNVTNLGEIVATAGRIGMAGVIVRNSGTLNASSVVSEGGRVFLKASKDTYVDGAGRIVATGTKGGKVEVLGERVAVMDQASIDVSGTNGGGTVLVGGDYQGKNPDIKNATVTYFGSEASIKADATDEGDGGKVIVWADDTTRAYGNISARGGANGGNGGFVETSGKGHLSFAASVDTQAPLGRAGTLLLDPTDITIDASGTVPAALTQSGGVFSDLGNVGADTIGWGYINGVLSANNVVIQTSSAGGGAGNITVTNAGVLAGSAYSLSLLAENNLTVNAGATIHHSGTGNLTLVSGWNSGSGYTTPTATHASTTGNMTINADITNNAVNGGNITLKSKGAMTINNAQVRATGNMMVDAGTLALAANGALTGLISGGTQAIRVGNAWNANGTFGLSTSNSMVKVAAGGAQTIAFYGSAANTLTLSAAGASTAGSSAEITSGGNQQIVNAAGSLAISLTGGNATDNTQSSYKDYGLATQQTICTNCATHNSARIKAGGTQAITANQLDLTGGSGGNGNSAEIDSVGNSTISVSGAVTVTGGTSGGAYYSGFGHDGYVSNDAGVSSDATLTLSAQNLTLAAANANYGGVYIGGGPFVNITTTGNATMSAGGGTSGGTLDAANPAPAGYIWYNPVAIGNDKGTPTVTLNIGGDLTMTGAAMGATGGSPVMIGGLDVPATVAINGNGNVTLNSATQFADRIGSSVNGGSVTIKSGLGGTGSMNLGKGLVAAGTNGTVTLEAGGTGAAIGQNALGRILAGTLYASTTTPIGAIGLAGLNIVNNVTLSANNAVLYNSASSFKAVSVASTSTTTSGTVTLSSLYGGHISLGSVSAGYGATVNASGAIYEENGVGTTDITAGVNGVQLFSQYGAVGSSSLAISADIATSGPVQSRVYDIGGAGYGGIRIRNTTATAPTSVWMQDDAHYSGGVSYYNTSSFTAGAGYSLSTTWTGDVKLGSGGDLTINAPGFGGPGTTYLSAAGGLTVGAALSRGTGNLDLSAGGLLNVANNVSATVGNVSLSGGTVQVAATVTAVAGTASVKGSNITMTSGSVNAGSVDLSGGSLTAYGSSIVGATGVKGDFTGDVRLNDGSTMSASTGSVSLTLRGATSGLYLNETPLNSPASRIISGGAAADKVNVTFTARAADGIVIDGVTTDTSAAGGSGLFVGNSSTPAVTGSTLNLVYAAAAPVVSDVISAIISSTSPPSSGPQQITSLSSTTGSTDGVTSLGSQTVGGTTDTFGGEPTTTDSPGDASGGKDEKKEDKKDDSTKKADSGEKKDDKSKSKPVGKCSA